MANKILPDDGSSGGTTWQPYPPAPAQTPDPRQQAEKQAGVKPVGAERQPNDPGPPPPGYTSWAQYYATQAAQNAAYQNALAGGSGGSASDLAEKKREFDLTYQRDIAKENASEVDSLQKLLTGMTGPKDVYGDLFFSHNLQAPQGYKPAPVPLTQAQIGAYKQMGVTPQQLQGMLGGTGQPGADAGMLGSLGSSLQLQPGQPGYTPLSGQITPQGPSNPTQQGGALYGKAPAGSSVAPGTPSMAVGGEVPGRTGDPRLIVAHGGEQIDNNTDQGQLAPMNDGGVHPAIQKLMDALSELLANPDFQQFAGVAGKAASMSRPPAKSKGAKSASHEATQGDATQGPMAGPMSQMAPGPQVTPGGIQSMATGGTVASGWGANLNPTPPIKPTPVPGVSGTPTGTTTSPAGAGAGYIAPHGLGTSGPGGMANFGAPATGQPLGGANAVTSFTGSGQPADNPVMPLAQMDPYARALYDVHGRLHPYSAQQLAQMGPQGQTAVESYVGKVEGGDVNAYTDLAKRLMPQGQAPAAGDSTSTGGFTFG